MDPDQTALQSDLGPHCLPVCKNRFEKFARIFSRRQKQTTFSDADSLGVLRVKTWSPTEDSNQPCRLVRIFSGLAEDAKFLHVDDEDSYQTAWMVVFSKRKELAFL